MIFIRLLTRVSHFFVGLTRVNLNCTNTEYIIIIFVPTGFMIGDMRIALCHHCVHTGLIDLCTYPHSIMGKNLNFKMAATVIFEKLELRTELKEKVYKP